MPAHSTEFFFSLGPVFYLTIRTHVNHPFSTLIWFVTNMLMRVIQLLLVMMRQLYGKFQVGTLSARLVKCCSYVQV